MRRFLENELKIWQAEKQPLPLIIRGPRQVGKTFIVEKFARENFENFVLVNFEFEREYRNYFKKNLDPVKFIKILSAEKNIEVKKGKTLIFFDEIQESPDAIQALRYFYEKLPGLHVIAAGSLLEFALNSKDFKMPVGRIAFKYLKPMSFYEFLIAQGKNKLFDFIKTLNFDDASDDVLHQALLKELQNYYLVGGMPAVVKAYIDSADQPDQGMYKVQEIQQALLQTYKRDFGKYAKATRHDDLQAVFEYVPRSISKKFKYSNVYPEAKSRDMKIAFDLLLLAGLCTKIRRSSAEFPLGSEIAEKHFKALFLDIGLMCNSCGLTKQAFLQDDLEFKFSGAIAEQLVGQELLANQPSYKEPQLFYWQRLEPGADSELDYLLAIKNQVIPVEVKSGKKGKLRSLRFFMDQYKSKLGVRLSARKLEREGDLISIPLYATAEIERLISI